MKQGAAFFALAAAFFAIGVSQLALKMGPSSGAAFFTLGAVFIAIGARKNKTSEGDDAR